MPERRRALSSRAASSWAGETFVHWKIITPVRAAPPIAQVEHAAEKTRSQALRYCSERHALSGGLYVVLAGMLPQAQSNFLGQAKVRILEQLAPRSFSRLW